MHTHVDLPHRDAGVTSERTHLHALVASPVEGSRPGSRPHKDSGPHQLSATRSLGSSMLPAVPAACCGEPGLLPTRQGAGHTRAGLERVWGTGRAACSRSPPCRPPISPSLAEARPAPNGKAPLPAQGALRRGPARGMDRPPRPPPCAASAPQPVLWGPRTAGQHRPPAARTGPRPEHARCGLPSLPAGEGQPRAQLQDSTAARGGGRGRRDAGKRLNSFSAGRWPPRPSPSLLCSLPLWRS